MKVPHPLRAIVMSTALLGGPAVVVETAQASTSVANVAVVKTYTITQLAGKQVEQLDEQCVLVDGNRCSRYSSLNCGISFDAKVKVTWFTCRVAGFTTDGVRVMDSSWSTGDGIRLTTLSTPTGNQFSFRAAYDSYGTSHKPSAMRCSQVRYGLQRDSVTGNLQVSMLNTLCRRGYRGGGEA